MDVWTFVILYYLLLMVGVLMLGVFGLYFINLFDKKDTK